MGQGFALFAGTAPEVIRASAREAEGLGYTSFWVNHPGATDGLAALALAAKETRRIDLGIGVIPLHTRGPDSIVQGVQANALPLDRLLLGLGSPNPDALKRVRAGIAELRARLSTRLIVAALGPQMCRLAGEVAGGVLFNWLTPEHARRSAESVRAGAEALRLRPRGPRGGCMRETRGGRGPLRGDSGVRGQLRAHGGEAGGDGHRRAEPRRHPARARRVAGGGRRGRPSRRHRQGHGRGERGAPPSGEERVGGVTTGHAPRDPGGRDTAASAFESIRPWVWSWIFRSFGFLLAASASSAVMVFALTCRSRAWLRDCIL